MESDHEMMGSDHEIEALIAEGSDYAGTEQFDKANEAFARALELGSTDSTAFYGRAFCLRKLGDYEQAQVVLEKALPLYPDDLRFVKEQALLHYNQQRYKEATESFDQALIVDGYDELVLWGKAVSLRLQRRFDEAEEAIAEALRRLPGNATLLNERGLLRYDQRRYEEAIEDFDEVLATDAGNETALQWRIASLRLQRHFDEAEEAVEEALELLPESVVLLNERAALRYDQQQYEEARGDFDQVLTLDENNEYAHWGEGSTLRLQKRFDEAEEAIAEALRRLPGNATLLNERGLLRYDQRRYEEAIEDFDEVLATDAGNETALQWRITSLRFQRRFGEAEEAIREALELLPGNARLLNERGWLRYDQQQYEEAVAVFNRVLEIDESNEDALKWKVTSLRLHRRYGDAEEAIREALDRLPESVVLLNEWGWLRYDQRRYEEAIENFNRTLEVQRDNEFALQGRVTSLRFQRRFGEAEEAVEEALDRLPESVVLLNERGLLRYDQHRYAEAREDFDRVLATDERNETALLGKAASLRLQRRFDETEEAIREALKRLPDNASIVNEHGLLHLDRNRFDQADACFAKAIKLDPGWVQPYFSRAEALKKMNRNYEALEVLQGLKRSFPDDPEVREQLGWFYVGRNDPINAMREFRGILERDDNDVSGITGLGAAYFSQGRYEDAADRFREVLDAAPDIPIHHTNLAWALVRQEKDAQLDEAEEHCREALKLESDLTQAFGCLGIIAFKRGNLREAEDYLRTSIEVSPREGSYGDLGALYVQMGRYDEARKNLEKAIEINRDDARARVELGNLYLQTDEVREGVRELRQAMAIDPNAADPPRALAIALMRAGEFGEAEKILRDAIRHLDEPQRWQLHLTLCQLLTSVGDETGERLFYEEALKEVNEAVRLKPKHPDPYFHAGIVRFKLEDYRKAAKNFRSCLKRDENHYEADRNARRVQELLRSNERIQRDSALGGVAIGSISAMLVGILWAAFFFTNKVTETMLTVMTPILLGLVVVAFLLPGLIRLKLPGLEAELSQPQESVSAGPKGDVGFGGSQPTISSGPR